MNLFDGCSTQKLANDLQGMNPPPHRTWSFEHDGLQIVPEKSTDFLGVHAQAPFQSGCEVLFYSFDLSNRTIEDFRSGE